MSNDMLFAVQVAALEQVGNSPEVEAAWVPLQEHYEEIRESLGYTKMRAIEQAVAEVYFLYAEKMFAWGWRLRDDPNLLATLRDDE